MAGATFKTRKEAVKYASMWVGSGLATFGKGIKKTKDGYLVNLRKRR